MLPIILISQKITSAKKFLREFADEEKIAPYDIFTYSPLKNEITIHQIREIKKNVRMKTGFPRLIVLFDFDSASSEAQNAFLKTLEEKGEENFFVLVVKNEAKLLPTIRSRSRTQRLTSAKDEKIAEDPLYKLLALIQRGTDLKFLNTQELNSLTRDKAILIFDRVILIYRDMLKKGDMETAQVLKKVMEIKFLVEQNNVNPQLAVDNLLIFIWKMNSMN
ncbi:hypothetical protein A2866_03485 [Candidatus Roizmanbacteria bacterium RIFCSPHIGHO2_01_FULL_39_8]|uniref:DNA polymerase III delta N-terminal domain-containing protein n=3 Tax=Candidatus Roizmaniibacteriota TaxID=1752723 RepID=A0A1F7GRT8_9BACT|nr:MAG: hypothetical protein A2866_03485 [Candidatus Roizmanbacteria bacterium RIFCSPHIGHO2_01_FULL_39_8]OGK26849.1 MAG: hypothetical protein A3C28_01075 [Candidatus Roizmanbacteria bacterium RIFCSPHIGHO2_02_FULL_39_9]OGK34732.1 MAG: hypothetical protein A3F60_02745 [Candidatus Roizmanbacteria bacterium RIFCSPHIGHO2_12_FULL_39_8]